MKRFYLLSVVPILLLSTVAHAQEDHQHHHDANERIGNVNCRTSCSPRVQAQFNRAVAWLHSFEYGESERQFNDVAKLDPNCAMAHWGAAMSVYHQLWAPPTPEELQKAAQSVQKAKQIGAKSPR